MGNFQKLQVWQLAKNLSVRIYKMTQHPDFANDYGFKDQMQRSSVSIPSNIAEGDELGTDRQSVKYFYIAKASSAELLTQIIIGNEIGYIESAIADELVGSCRIISVMLTKLIKARSNGM